MGRSLGDFSCRELPGGIVFVAMTLGTICSDIVTKQHLQRYGPLNGGQHICLGKLAHPFSQFTQNLTLHQIGFVEDDEICSSQLSPYSLGYVLIIGFEPNRLSVCHNQNPSKFQTWQIAVLTELGNISHPAGFHDDMIGCWIYLLQTLHSLEESISEGAADTPVGQINLVFRLGFNQIRIDIYGAKIVNQQRYA